MGAPTGATAMQAAGLQPILPGYSNRVAPAEFSLPPQILPWEVIPVGHNAVLPTMDTVTESSEDQDYVITSETPPTTTPGLVFSVLDVVVPPSPEQIQRSWPGLMKEAALHQAVSD